MKKLFIAVLFGILLGVLVHFAIPFVWNVIKPESAKNGFDLKYGVHVTILNQFEDVKTDLSVVVFKYNPPAATTPAQDAENIDILISTLLAQYQGKAKYTAYIWITQVDGDGPNGPASVYQYYYTIIGDRDSLVKIKELDLKKVSDIDPYAKNFIFGNLKPLGYHFSGKPNEEIRMLSSVLYQNAIITEAQLNDINSQ